MQINHQAGNQHFGTIIIGAGQAGLAAGYHLKQLKEDFLIIDGAEEIGHSWGSRWDSLRLFTPTWANSLPGMPEMTAQGKFATKEEMARYLRLYANKYQLPVRLKTRVSSLSKTASGYEVLAGEQKLTCRNVIVATGNYSTPKLPSFASELDKNIHQLHSSAYRNPSDLPPGPVLVVGAGTSGLQIALDVAASGRQTYVAGNPPGRIPDFVFKYIPHFFVWFMRNILTVKTIPGRKVGYQVKQGAAAPLINISLEQVTATGVEHLPKLKGAAGGYLFFENDRHLKVDGIIWCTGYNRDFSWIKLDRIADDHGYPLSYRGVATYHKGLYYVGMMFQFALASAQIGGVGRDAAFVARHIHRNA